MSDCWQEKRAGEYSPPGIPLQTNPNSDFSKRTHSDNSLRHFCINQPSGGKSTQVFHKWSWLDFSAFFQEELNSRIHKALEVVAENWSKLSHPLSLGYQNNTHVRKHRVSIALDDTKFVLSWCRRNHGNWEWNKSNLLSASVALCLVAFCPVLIKRHIMSLLRAP